MTFLPDGYIEVQNPILSHPEFMTHSNYLLCMKELSDGVALTTSLRSTSSIIEHRAVQKKVKLIELTLNNLREEKRNIDQLHEYSMICVSWIPVKSYYLVFNILLLLEYLLLENDSWLTTQHKELRDKFRNQIATNQICFSEPAFNQCFPATDIIRWTIPKSENLRRSTVDQNIRIKQIVKKIYEYDKEDFKRLKKIKRLAGSRLTNYNNSRSVCLFDFFYWYRIKANYRDMEFVDSGVPIGEFYNFYSDYFMLTTNIYEAFKSLINELSEQKLGRQIL